MAPREEIREGIEEIILHYGKDSPDPGYGYEREEMAQDILQLLHSQGVVIKEKRDLPHPWRDDCMSAHSETCKTCDNCDILEWAWFDLIESGYEATVPLIEKV